MIEICICPFKALRYHFSRIDPTRTAAVISTSGELPDPSRLCGISYLCLQYRDIDVEAPGCFTDADAGSIADFIRTLDASVTTLFVCCDAAVSRSPAVAAAIARYFGQDDEALVWKNPAYSPNMLVFEKLTRALGIPVDDDICDRLFYENRKAFQDAIKKGRR